MKIASIDIGSNTVLLLIAKIENNVLFPVLNEYRSPRLAKGLIKGDKIQNDTVNKLLHILKEYKTIIEFHNCSEVLVTATNAMRIASNSNQIIRRIGEKFGWTLNVISGDEEADLSFWGASSSFADFNEKVVIDIGGGSTEVIYGNNSKIVYRKSFQTGVVSLTEKFLSDFPYSNSAIFSANNYLKETFRIISNEIPNSIPTIAVAGTPTTLSCIVQNLKIYNDSKVEGSKLTSKNFRHLFNSLVSLSSAEIKLKYGQVVEGREDILFSGLLILEHIRKLLLADIIYVSSRGLRYGNIINYIK